MVDGRGTQAQLHGAGMTGEIECRFYGRDFTAGEMALHCALIAAEPPPTRHALSREFCRRIRWLKPGGGLKDMMAMHRDGLIALPPLFPVPTALDEVRPRDLRTVVCGTREGKL